MSTVKTLDEIKKLPLGTTLYRPTPTKINWWYYAGINPKSEQSIMLISSGNIQDIHGEYWGNDNIYDFFYLSYEEACKVCFQKAQDNVKKVKRIFLKEEENT